MDKQQELDQQVSEVIIENGCHNILYAEQLRMMASLVQTSDSTILKRFRPNLKLYLHSQSYQQALKLVLAFLKVNKMNETKATLKIEFPEIPKEYETYFDINGGRVSFPSIPFKSDAKFEIPEIPKKSGFSHRSELDEEWEKLFEAHKKASKVSFNSKSAEFYKTLGI